MPDEQLTFGFADQPPTAETLPPTRLTRAQRLAAQAAALAGRGVYVGTSSWKYPAWLGQVYDPARYAVRGRLSERKFRDECLAEYATVFPTVCGDFAFYQFPTDQMWKGIFEQLPAGYKFALKVPEDVTMERFPKQPRYGERAGQVNMNFMDPVLVKSMLIDRLEPYRDKLGPLIFEFTAIHNSELVKPTNFAEALDRMFSRLPCDRFEWAVEVRNPHFLQPSPPRDRGEETDAATRRRGDAERSEPDAQAREASVGRGGEGETERGGDGESGRRGDKEHSEPEAQAREEPTTHDFLARASDSDHGNRGKGNIAYLDVLRNYGVAHVLNSWTRMPPINEQMRIPGIFTANHVVSRWLLRPGRTYAQAVEAFTPYETTKDPYPQGRQALRDLIDQFVPDQRVFYAFVNNRFEGSAVETIENVLAEVRVAG